MSSFLFFVLIFIKKVVLIDTNTADANRTTPQIFANVSVADIICNDNSNAPQKHNSHATSLIKSDALIFIT